MTSRDFCYWLQGLFELGSPRALDEQQTAAIKRHLALVFTHEIDPSAGGPAVQELLNSLHNPKPIGKEGDESAPPGFTGHSKGPTVFRC